MQYVADALVGFAELTSSDVLFDLGCNDGRLLRDAGDQEMKIEQCLSDACSHAGRVVITAAKLAGLIGVGVEIAPEAAAKAQHNVVAGGTAPIDHASMHV